MTKVTMRGPRAQAEPTPAAEMDPEIGGAAGAGEAPTPGARSDVASILAGIPNFGVKEQEGKGGQFGQQMTVTFGNPKKTAVIRVVDVADEWDLAEMAGDASKNDQWLMMARAAFAVLLIDGTSYFPGKNGYDRNHLRGVMRALGAVGMNAIALTQAGVRPGMVGVRPETGGADPAVVAKNS